MNEAGRAVGLNQHKRGRNFCMLMDLYVHGKWHEWLSDGSA
jgi:hypothetical protein